MDYKSNINEIGTLIKLNDLFYVDRATGNVYINTTSNNASSIFSIASTTKGVLLPRMTETQINAINLPATGLMVYNTSINHMCMFDGSNWKKLSMSNM
jgi:hypothetical protein